MKNYGMPYMGSKNLIAKDIIDFLPSGERLVDLFGGGGAITDCALQSGKWKKVLYNELNPLVYNFMKDLKNGRFNKNNFKNEWVDRETFDRLKNKDGYIAYVWSFGNNGDSYIYSKYIEPWKKAYHYARVLGNYELLKNIGIETNDASRINILHNEKEYQQKYNEWYIKNKIGDIGKVDELCHLQSLERLQRLQSLEALQRLQSLEALQRLPFDMTKKSYETYEYKSGDVVYCDPPYYKSVKYKNEQFDSIKFFNWVASRNYKVYFSNYELPPEIIKDRFELVWKKVKRVNLSKDRNNKGIKKIECIYSNKLPNGLVF